MEFLVLRREKLKMVGNVLRFKRPSWISSSDDTRGEALLEDP